MRHLIRIVAAAVGVLTACVMLAGRARADTYPVNDPSDLPDVSVGDNVCATSAGNCTLRAAVQEANAHAGPDSITLPAGTYILSRTGAFEANAFTGDLDLRDTIMITGAGRGLTFIDGNLNDRIFDVFPAVGNTPMTATLSGLTIRRGGNVGTGCGMDINGSQTRVYLSRVDIRDGACQYNFGYGGIYFYNAFLLSLNDVVIDNNTGYYGGGVYQYYGQVFISGTLISNNSGANGAGAQLTNGFVSIQRSAIVNNRATSYGGGLYLSSVAGGMTSTTIAENSAIGAGGGLYLSGSGGFLFGWDSIARNTSASSGGGVYVAYDLMKMRGTLIGANAAPSGPDVLCSGGLSSQGSTLIGDIASCPGGYYTAGAGDIVNVNPGLGAAISAAGTRVIPLVHGSRAIDAGGAGCPTFDQRNLPRPADGDGDGTVACDIGAYEKQGLGELSVSGFVYADANLNGAFTPGVDPGVPGVTITLQDLGSGQIVTSSSAVDGSFGFGALTTGTYALREDQPAGFDDGADALGTAGGVSGNDVMTVSLAYGTQAISYTFGELPFAVVSGTVYLDYDGNGAYDPQTDGGVYFAVVSLTGASAKGQPVSLSTSTDGYGRFTFFPVPPGVYTLTETQPNSYYDGEEAVGSAGGVIAGAGPNFDVIANIPVTYGAPVTGYLFGEYLQRFANAFVYADLNANGVYEYGEYGLQGVPVRLTGVTYRGGAVSQTLLTDNGGSAYFSGIAPGIYTLTESQPLTWADGLDRATGVGVAGDDLVSGIALTGTVTTGGATFGELQPGVSGLVYLDANANGRYDAENGLAGVSVWLSGIAAGGAGEWMTATTDSFGRFFFTPPSTGTYALSEQQPSSLLDGLEQIGPGGGITGAIGVDTISAIAYTPTTLAGRPAAAAGYTFAEVQASSLEGFTYLDADNSQYLSYYGSCPASCDPPVFGVTMVLTGVADAGQSVWMTTTTTTGTMQYYSYVGARYVFTPVRPGVYSIIELQPAGYVDGPANPGSPGGTAGRNRVDQINLPPAYVGQYYNFGEYPAALSGYVYRDADNDGYFRRGSESGLSNVGITLTFRTITGATGIQTVQTDNYGRYAFTGLVTGVYTLTELQPPYYADGREAPGDLPAAIGNDIYAGIAYTPGVGAGWFNFAEVDGASLNVTVFWDRNGDSLFDNYIDVSIPNITVTLTGTTDSGGAIGPIALNPGPYNSAVTFDRLSPGVYSVVETQPSGGYVDGPSIIGNYFGGVPGVNRIDSITIITPGYSGYNYAFTERKPGLSGFAYVDANNNRVHDRTEGGYSPQQTFVLSSTGGGSLYSTTVAGSDSFFMFSAIPSGTYQLTAGQPSVYLDNFDQPGTVDGLSSGTAGPLGTDIITGILYTTNAVAINYDFGELSAGRIRGTVYHDQSGDGSLQNYEPGIRYVTVTLAGLDDVGAPVLLSRVTDQYGAFDFNPLRPGLYTLTETQPAGWTDGPETATYVQPALIADNRFQGITLTNPGSDLYGFLFGELQPGLSGMVYRDAQNDGIYDSYNDSGLFNVQLLLSGTTAAGQTVYSMTLTDGYGRFGFYPLLTGTYVLSEAQPSLYLDGLDTPGTLGGTPSSLPNGADLVSGIPITAASYGRNYLFAEIPPAQINGVVYLDLNGDGYYAFSEPGVLSATLTLSGTNERGQQVVIVTTTNAAGQFYFVNLRPGSYTLSETQPAGYLDGIDRAPNGTLSAVNDVFENINVSTGFGYGQYQFGESGSFLSGYVYSDKNNDGIRGSGENGVQFATLYLTGTRSDTGAAVGRVSQTDNAGVYQFVNVPNGVYTITELQPAGFFDGKETLGAGAGGVISGNDRFISLTMTGPGGTNYNFGEIAASTFNGAVYFDIDDNGVRGQNEPGIGGALLVLRGTDYLTQPVWMTTTTALYGTFGFTNVRMGVYTLTELQPDGYLDGKDALGCCGGGVLGNDNIYSVTVLGSDTLIQYSFGERISGLSGYVYVDYNNNGLRDDGGYGIGTPVWLYGQTALGQLVTRTMDSDGYGFYFFNDLMTGTYRISAIQHPAYLDGLDMPGSLGGAAVGFDEIAGIVFQVGQYGAGYNFGELPPAYLNGSVYWDVNNDGSPSGGEPGIVPATVVLSGTDDLGQGVRITTTTGGGGSFSFTALRPGVYTLIEVQPSDYTDGLDAAGDAGGTPDGFDAIRGITLQPGQYASGYRFGERQVGLTGFVYQDVNNDGLRQPAETGIPNVLIALNGTTSLGAPVFRVAVSSLYGFYAFGDLVAGDYAIAEYQPNGYLDGKEQIGTIGGLRGPDVFTVTLGAGQYGGEYNFGELPPAAIGGTVYIDINNNGTHQNSEASIQGVNLGLTGIDDLGTAVLRAAVSNYAGLYSFGNLRPGVYTLTEIQPAGYNDGQESVGNLGGTLIPTDTIAWISLTVGANGYDYNFGEQLTGLGGFVFIDANGNGAFNTDSETTLNGVTMILTGTPAGGNPLTRTTETDFYGFYSFGDLPAGSYRIREIQPPAYLDGPDYAGPQGGAPGPLGQDYIDVTFAGSGFGTSYNFSEYPPNTLRGYVFFDLNDNGRFEWPPLAEYPFYDQVKSSAETPVGGGVKIVLTGRNDLSQTIWTTDTTNASGQYSFPMLRTGLYTLTEIQRDVDVDGKDSANHAPEAITTNDQVRGISLTIGETKGASFGEKPSIVGWVYRDDNDNGAYEPNLPTFCNSPELGIGGVTMQLTGVDVYNNNVTLNATTFTPPPEDLSRCYQGIYYWGGLVTGTYAIREFQPAGYLDGRETVGTGGGLTTTNDIISRIVFTPGTVITGYLFGETRNSIAGYVYLDQNGNGVRDGWEGGQLDSPVVIWLTGTNTLGQNVVLSQTVFGYYQFSGLRPGTYTVTEWQPAGYADGEEQLGVGAGGAISGNDRFINLVLAPGALASDYNFGELINSSISGRVAYVWYRGSMAWGGQGLVSQTIQLTGIPNGGALITQTALTDASGYYRFLDLPPGVYTVTQVNFPTGYDDFGVYVCAYGAAAAGRAIVRIPLQYGSFLQLCDFKLGPVLTGNVFADDNGNGAMDSGEYGTDYTTVSLYGTLSNGALTTQTLSTGGYFAFGGLQAGTYRLVEAQPVGYYDGVESAGTLGGLTGDAALAAEPAWSPPITDDIIAGIVYTPNAVGVNYLFAELRPARLSGLVYYDKDDNAYYSPWPGGLDEPVDRVDVFLDGTNDLGEAIRMTNTEHSFNYIFSGLRPGTYTLTEVQPVSYTDGIDNVGTKGGVVGDDQIRFINITWGDDARNYNFGERRFGIVGRVFADRNNNGAYEYFLPESGINGALVWLTGTTILGNPVFLTYTTDNDGYFGFPELQPGVYTLSETQPAGYADGLDAVGTLGGLLSNDRISNIVVGEHSFGEAYTFGELSSSSLSGYVYVDANNDGYRGGYGEPGIAGVTITLQGEDIHGAPILMVTRTEQLGYYIFRGIPNGNYSLIETQPNFVDGIDRAGTGAGGVALDDLIVGIGFNIIADATDYNFGERPSALSGHVFWDENGNGTRQISETGLSPATLKLHGVDFNNQPVNKTTKTTFEGYYAFEALPGTYWIEEIQPFGYLNGLAIPGTLGGVISETNVIANIVVGIGGAGSDYDFAEVAPMAIDLARAMGVDLAFLQNASLQVDLINKAGVGRPLPGTATLAGFPTEGPTFAYLGTGNMLFADQPNSGPNTFGLGDYARLVLTVTVPTTATCMSMDFAFFSEEFPEFVGSQFNDTFDAFVDGRPVARDQNGNRISINSVFGATPANAAGTTYDAATPRLRSQAEVTPGATSVISFFITDVSDTAYDSAVFIDKFTFGRPEGSACVPGANLPVAVVLTKTVGVWPEVGNPVCGLTDVLTITQPTEIAYCYRATNTGEYTLTTHTLADSAFGTLFSQMPQELLPGETYEFMTSRVETRTTVSVGTWTGWYSATFAAAATDVTTVTLPGPVITPTPAPGSAAVMVMPAMAQTYFTQPITVAVMISGVTNLGSYEVALRFDPSQVTATNVSQGSFLTSTGRTLVPLPARIGPDYMRFGASTVGGMAGPSGSGALAWVRIAPRDTGTLTLALSNTLATNVAGLSITLTAQGGQLYVIYPGAAYLPRVLR